MVQLPPHNALVIYQWMASGSFLSFFDFQTTIISSVLIITQTCQTGEEGGWEGGGEQNCSFYAVLPKLEGKTRKREAWWGTGSAGGGLGRHSRSWKNLHEGHLAETIALVSRSGRVSRHLLFLRQISLCWFKGNHLDKGEI